MPKKKHGKAYARLCRGGVPIAVLAMTLSAAFTALPSLAAAEQTVYFNNALSQYDRVEYTLVTPGGATRTGTMVSAGGKLLQIPQAVEIGSRITFTGYDSGTVYDTVSNYRVNSASREWGYDYVNFRWTSDTLTLGEDWDCYFAPPTLMYNRYGGYAAVTPGGAIAQRQFISAHGENRLDPAGATQAGIAKPETNASPLRPESAVSRTFYDAAYPMEGQTGSHTDVNRLAESSNAGEGKPAVSDAGTGIPAGTMVYQATATFYDYYSDWELAGKNLSDHTTSYPKKIEDAFSDRSQHNLSGSFSEGTSRISYVYMGNLWNQAVSEWYRENGASVPLYWGSNSWFTGNHRYETEDRNGNAFQETIRDTRGSTPVDVVLGQTYPHGDPYILYPVRADNFNADNFNLGAAYLYPAERQYLNTLYHVQDNNAANIAMGQSNSRGVAELVDISNGVVIPAGTAANAPYFDEAFIKGNNAFSAELGEVYKNVEFDFMYDPETGYYQYDSTRAKYATLLRQRSDGGYYMQYTGDGVKKGDTTDKDPNGSSQTIYQFYPFNSTATNDTFATENLMFGMKLDIPFTIMRNPEERQNSIFKFSGDDDVWISVDGEKVLDIGGTHTACGGFVDLKTGYAAMSSTYDPNTGVVVGGSVDPARSGTGSARTDIEKAAFALLSSVGIDPAMAGQPQTLSQAAFFDDRYSPVSGGTINFTYTIDGDYITVQFGDLNAVNESGKVTSQLSGGAARFRMTKLEGYGSSTQTPDEMYQDLESHMLTVYYMERGLNSSNFKLAFNLVENAKREVEKVWLDDLDHSNDSVTVDLYRADVIQTQTNTGSTTTQTVHKNGTFIWPADMVLVKGSAGSKTSALVPTGQRTKLDFGVHGDLIRRIDLTLSGMPLTWEFYSILRNSAMQLRIIKDGAEITQSCYNTDAQGQQYIMADPSHPAGRDGSNDKGGAGAPNFEIYFNPMQSITANSTPDSINFYSDGWLFEAQVWKEANWMGTNNRIYPTLYSVDENDENPEPLSGGVLESDGRILSTDDLRFILHHTARTKNWTNNQNDGIIYSFSADVVPKADAVRAEWKPNSGNRAYNLLGRSGDLHTNLNSGANNYATVDAYTGANISKTYTDSPLSLTDDAELYYYVASNAANRDKVGSSIWIPNDVRLYAQGSFDVFATYNYDVTEVVESPPVYRYSYTEPAFLTTVTLRDGDWSKLWENLIRIRQFPNDDNTTYPLKYYVRERGWHAEDNALVTGYETVYLKSDGTPASTELHTENQGGSIVEFELYNIDTEDGKLTIQNKPRTKLAVKKIWGTGAEVKDSIRVTVFNDRDNTTETLVLRADPAHPELSWYAELTDLALCTDTGQRIHYYAAEEDLGEDYDVRYSTEVTRVFGAANTEAYAFDETNSLTVTNNKKHVGPESFRLEIVKRSDSAAPKPLQGAVIRVEVSDDGSSFAPLGGDNGLYRTDADGKIPEITDLTAEGKTYRVSEYQAPLGYITSDEAFVFTVAQEADGTFRLVTQSEPDTLLDTAVIENDLLTVGLKNAALHTALPETGGSGTARHNAVCVLIILISAAGFVLTRSHKFQNLITKE